MKPRTDHPTPSLPATLPVTVPVALVALFVLLATLAPAPPCAAATPHDLAADPRQDREGPAGEPDRPAAGDEGTSRLEIHRRSGLEPPQQQAMEDWHRRYVRLAGPVKDALAKVLEARRGHLPQRAAPHCRRLVEEIGRFRRRAREERLLPLADAAADLHLKRLYRRLEDAGRACAAERWAAAEEHLRQAGQAFRQAQLALGRWGLEP